MRGYRWAFNYAGYDVYTRTAVDAKGRPLWQAKPTEGLLKLRDTCPPIAARTFEELMPVIDLAIEGL